VLEEPKPVEEEALRFEEVRLAGYGSLEGQQTKVLHAQESPIWHQAASQQCYLQTLC
jgi:hypothetical protein